MPYPQIDRRRSSRKQTDSAVKTVTADAPDLSTCLPAISGMDWTLIRRTPCMIVGAGAVGRPLAGHLAWLGIQRCMVVDPKRYKRQSVVSQCHPVEVGRPKAEVVAAELAALGVSAVPLVEDIEVVPPGYIEPETVMIVGVDNRRADIIANRLAALMRIRLVKVNVEPLFLAASIRAYDFRSGTPRVCVECQMTDEQYADQHHPLSCEGGEEGNEQPTGSPRALCGFAASATALAVAQIVGSPDNLAKRWLGRQWQQLLLGGVCTFSELDGQPTCRWDHQTHWRNLHRLKVHPAETTLAALAAKVRAKRNEDDWKIQFSARVTTETRCERCRNDYQLIRWVPQLDQAVGACRCGGLLKPMPCSTFHSLTAGELTPVWKHPLANWGVPPKARIALETGGRQWSFIIDGRSNGCEPSAAADRLR